MSRRIAAAALILVALVGLTSCAGFPLPVDGPAGVPSDSPGDDGQSTAEACQLIQDTVAQAAAEFERLTDEDAAAVAEAMAAAAERLADAASQVTNDEVAALLPPLQTMFERVAEVMSAAVAGDQTRLMELPGLVAEFQEAGERFQEACAPR